MGVNGVWIVLGWCLNGCACFVVVGVTTHGMLVNNLLRKQVAPIVGTCVCVMMIVRVFDRPVELVHPHLGVELDDGLGEGAGPRPRLEGGRLGSGDGGGRGDGAGALPHRRSSWAGGGGIERHPPQTRLADPDQMVRGRRLANVMDAVVVRVSVVGFGDEGGGDAGQIGQRRPLGRLHGPVAKDAALGRRGGGCAPGVLIPLGEGDGGRSRCTCRRQITTCTSSRLGSGCGSRAVER